MSKKYKTTLFTFIDILGFREIVKNRNAKEIFEILSYLKKWSKPDEELAEIYEMDFCNFSDSVLRATKIYSKSNKKYPTGILFHELLDLVYIIRRTNKI